MSLKTTNLVVNAVLFKHNYISISSAGVDWKLKMQDIINKQAAESALLKCNNALDGHQKALILANYSQISDGEE